MLSPDDPEFFKTLSDKCLDLCKNNPSLVSNYKDVSNGFAQALDIFLNRYNKHCLETLTNFEAEREKFANVTREIEFQQYMTEMLVERSERFKMGSKTTQVKYDNYQHYLESRTKTTNVQKHRYNFKINDVISLTNVGELCRKKLHQNYKNFFMDVTNVKETPFEHKREFVTSATLQNKVFIAGNTSSFWSCINPTLGDAKIDYSSHDCNLDFTRLNEFLTNSESMKKFYEKSIYNQDVINDIVTKSQQVEPGALNKQVKRAEAVVFSASTTSNLTASNEAVGSGSETKTVSSINTSSVGDDHGDIAPPPDDDDDEDDVAPPPDNDVAPPPESEEEDQPAPVLYKALALFPYKAQSSAELGFEKDAVIDIIEQHDNGWLVGSLNGSQGYVPQNYVQKM